MNAIVGGSVAMMISAATTNTMTTSVMLNNDAHHCVLQPDIIIEGSVAMMIIATTNAAVTASPSRHCSPPETSRGHNPCQCLNHCWKETFWDIVTAPNCASAFCQTGATKALLPPLPRSLSPFQSGSCWGIVAAPASTSAICQTKTIRHSHAPPTVAAVTVQLAVCYQCSWCHCSPWLLLVDCWLLHFTCCLLQSLLLLAPLAHVVWWCCLCCFFLPLPSLQVSQKPKSTLFVIRICNDAVSVKPVNVT